MRIVDTARLYNTVTVLTLSGAVVVFYVCLLGLFILAVSIIVPSSLLEARLGHPIGLSNYIVRGPGQIQIIGQKCLMDPDKSRGA